MEHAQLHGPRPLAVLALALLSALALTPAAGARAHKVIGMPPNSTLLVAGSSSACGSGVKGGIGFVDCGISASNGRPKKGSYFLLLTGGGKINVVAASTTSIVFTRVAAARERPARRSLIVNTAHAGDQIILPTLTQITCRVAKVGGRPTIFCYYVDRRTGRIRPNSFSFGMSDTLTTVLGWNAAGTSRLVGHWAENG
jgi:hypothetical protein